MELGIAIDFHNKIFPSSTGKESSTLSTSEKDNKQPWSYTIARFTLEPSLFPSDNTHAHFVTHF